MKYAMARLSGIVAAAIGAALAMAPAAQAQASFEYTDAIRLLEARGLEAVYNEPAPGATGPVLNTEVNGFAFDMNFERCEPGGKSCNRVLFVAGFQMGDEGPSVEDINAWNANNYGKAFLDDDYNPWLSLEINTESGLSRAAFGTTMDWWEGLLEDFTAEIGYR
jgi:hypothetical protein